MDKVTPECYLSISCMFQIIKESPSKNGEKLKGRIFQKFVCFPNFVDTTRLGVRLILFSDSK